MSVQPRDIETRIGYVQQRATEIDTAQALLGALTLRIRELQAADCEPLVLALAEQIASSLEEWWRADRFRQGDIDSLNQCLNTLSPEGMIWTQVGDAWGYFAEGREPTNEP